MAHSVGVNARRISPIVTQMVSAERAAALRNKCLNLANLSPLCVPKRIVGWGMG